MDHTSMLYIYYILIKMQILTFNYILPILDIPMIYFSNQTRILNTKASNANISRMIKPIILLMHQIMGI